MFMAWAWLPLWERNCGCVDVFCAFRSLLIWKNRVVLSKLWFFLLQGFVSSRIVSLCQNWGLTVVHTLLYNKMLESVGSNKLSLMIPTLWVTGKLHLWVSFKRRCDKDIIYPDQTYSYLHTRSQGRWWGTLNPLKELYIAIYLQNHRSCQTPLCCPPPPHLKEIPSQTGSTGAKYHHIF